ncbi:MAG: MlrC domain protein [Phycisphaeraceae bacterium]|nr:MlrC domain protein [Phycisphaeraceae bacterium]
MRIGIIGFLHESNTFVGTTTTRADFAACHLDVGAPLLDRWRGTHHEVGGFLAGAEQFGFEPVPIVVAVAVPSGPVTEDAFESIWQDMATELAGAGRLDGMLLGLHGATVAQHVSDADGEIVTRVRRIAGPDMPVVMTLDLHANISTRMFEGVNATILYRTTPHVDQFDRGLDAAGLIAATVRGEVRPVQAMMKPPMIMDVIKHDTSEPPAETLRLRIEALVEQPSILSASVAYAYPRADVAEMGTSIIVAADGDQDLADRTARALADEVWSMRHEFVGDLPSPADAIREAVAHDEQPVVISDIGDNVGGGAPGDATLLLQEMLAQEVERGLFVIWDPEAAAACAAAGVGADVRLDIGGRTDPSTGPPITIEGRVRTLSDGIFYEPNPRHGGRTDNNQGLTAVIEIARRTLVAVNTERMAPFSLHQILSLGIDPKAMQIIIVKAAVAPRAAYRPVAAKFVMADTPGTTCASLKLLPYRHRRRPMFPLDPDAEW